ncbi:cache domain-containing protein [Vibrio profundum]|uniref:bifunctional diguanylate cyclase/phosphodiesterase n=1 Tax=Vibrio profundum TaxID=2910247 RepID=UPI003D110265
MNNQATSDSERLLLRSIQILPAALIFIFMCIIAVVLIREENRRTQDLLNGLQQDFVTNQKKIIKNQINNIYQQLEYEKSLTIELLKLDIKYRVEEAYAVVNGIYNANPDRPKEQVTNLIRKALYDVRFNEGRGYYFIFQMDGVNVMHPLLPHIEGTSKIGVQDLKGKFIVKEHIDLIKASEDGSAFYRWWYRKPGHGELEFEKIGYAKHFAPYDWFIGTGEYAADVEEQIKNRMLKWLTELRYGNDNYVFVMNMEGKGLAHKDKSIIGTTEAALLNLFKEKLEANPDERSGFVRYDSPYLPQRLSNPDKLSYIKLIEPWGWIIGTGVFTSDIESIINQQVLELERNNQEQLYRILSILVMLTGMLAILSIGASKFIGRRFSLYQERIYENIKELEESREKLRELAMIDTLTLIPNRTMLEENIHKGIQLSKLVEEYYAVLFVDLDDFKRTNDKYGHHVGDELLKSVSNKFKQLCGKKDVLARFGGDEFVFGFQVTSKEEAKEKADLIKGLFDEPFVLENTVVMCTCSIGVSVFPTDGNTVSNLLSKSDIALYRSKEQGKGQVLFYDHKINDEVQYDFSIEENLHHALRNNEISIYYQPKLEAKTGVILGVEALCRWNSSELGSVRPDDFIRIAEKTGLIVSIGKYILEKSCDGLHEFNAAAADPIKISINISPIQLLHIDFYDMIMETVKEKSTQPSSIVFEITENVIIEDLDKVISVLSKIHEVGFGISLDDFGTGYSSLRYLNSFPITEIKIDRAFVMRIGINEHDDTLIKTIVLIGLSMGLNIVAEGVENVEQRDRLRELGCHELQGYLFDPALSLEKLVSKYSGHKS